MAAKRPRTKKARRTAAPVARPASLLVELLTEELPPKSLRRLSEAFRDALHEALGALALLTPESRAQAFATPRRLAVRITGVLPRQPDRVLERRGPAVAAGLDAAGKPTPALLGFARSCGVEPAKLERQAGEKGEYFVYRSKQKGEPLGTHLAAAVESSLKKLPVAKLMRWGAGEAQFVRPVHGLVLLHGAKVISGAVLGVRSGNRTLGHRFLSRGPTAIPSAEKYEDTLRRASVIADFEERRETIRRAAQAEAKRRKAHAFLPRDWTGDGTSDDSEMMRRIRIAQWILGSNEELLDEVTAIVEWPAVYAGDFDPAFLAVPPQVISLTMQKNQKYLALVSPEAKLLPTYLVVSNIVTRKPKQIVHGNERVLRARLADARFFFETDKKTSLEARVPRLKSVVYLHKLGSQLDRVERLRRIAVAFAERMHLSSEHIEHADRAALLCKADLVSDMVGEFPELQGEMGAYYAAHDGEAREVARAIEAHYRPRHAGDSLPLGPVSLSVALADRLESIVGIYGIGHVPTGDKDPYALRRHALGVARILIERALPLELPDLIATARDAFPAGLLSEKVADEVYDFVLDRVRPYLREREFRPDEIEAVLSLRPGRLDLAVKRLEALQTFRRLPEAEALAAANKRIRNILRQAGGAPAITVDPALLCEEAERTLAHEVSARRAEVEPLYAAGEYAAALKRLAALRGPVDLFFDEVMVMAEDEALKRNRLALLESLSRLFLGAADISRLQS